MNFEKHLYLFRHGSASVGNEEDHRSITSGRVLLEEGFSEANALAESLADKQIDAFYVSPYTRSVQTAEVVAAKHPSASFTIDEHFGDGLFYNWDDISKEDAIESQKTLERVAGGFDNVLKTDYKNIAIVSHGGITRALLQLCGYKFGGIPTAQYFHLGFDGKKWTLLEKPE